MTHTMILDRSNNKISQIAGTKFSSKTKKLDLFAVIATKTVNILLEKMIHNIK